MDRIVNILVTYAGGDAAIGVIKSLKEQKEIKCNIIAVDSDLLSAGFYLADKYHVVPKANDPAFLGSITKIIEDNKIDLILPTGEEDLIEFSRNKCYFENLGTTLYISDYYTIKSCLDKKLTYDLLLDNIGSLANTTLNYRSLNFPFIMKPRYGRGSRDIHLISGEHELTNKYLGDYVFQEYLPGKEYTVDILCDEYSNILSCTIRLRLATKQGVSTKCKIIKNKGILDICSRICRVLDLKYVVNLQFKDDEYGAPMLMEVNPRFGGGTYFTTLAGVNLPLALLNRFLGKSYKQLPDARQITMVRYYNEMII